MLHSCRCRVAALRNSSTGSRLARFSLTSQGRVEKLASSKSMEEALDYRNWPAERLIQRVTDLENRLSKLNAEAKAAKAGARPASARSATAKRNLKKQRKEGTFDPSRYSTRFIALKFAYLGQRYNGLENHIGNITPLPTIEEELWKALVKTKLIFPGPGKEDEVNFDGFEYSKCGRTDKGVSAFGQVVTLRVRSARPVPGLKPRKPKKEGQIAVEDGQENVEEVKEEPVKEFDPIKDELPYLQILNRVLPHDIRMLAWAPDPPQGFDARHSCEERRYRYFFTNPGFAPVPGARGVYNTVQGKPWREGWLDIEAMQDAAKRLEGVHDFRNFCKIDPAKQIDNYVRNVYHASITEVDLAKHPVGYVGHPENEPGGVNGRSTSDGSAQSVHTDTPKLYTFNVNGSAFLWHQVRSMVAVLFLVGQGLESPSVVSDLLDPEKTPTRPVYEMASDAPLVLWDCIFPEKRGGDRKDAIKWIYIGDDGACEPTKPNGNVPDGKFGPRDIMDSLWTTWRQRKIDEILAGSLIDLVASQGRQTTLPTSRGPDDPRSVRVYRGGNEGLSIGTYTPIMNRKRIEHYSILNARWREKKALKGDEASVMDVDE